MNKLKYYQPLDGVRAVAALMVMVCHFFNGTTTTNQFQTFLKSYTIFGQTGVSLFFVLSGFLITRILIQSKTKERYFYNFYVNRALRIFPLYFGFLVFYYFIQPFIFNIPFIQIGQQIYYWVYLQNFAHTFHWSSIGPLHLWSLAVEEHFYLFWPLVIFYNNKKGIIFFIIALGIVAIVTRIILVYNNFDVYSFTFARLDELIFGALLAIIEWHKKYFKLKFFLLLLVTILLPTFILWMVNNSSGNSYIQVIKYLLLALTYFAVIGCIITCKETAIITKVLNTTFLNYTGKISYGLYVFHPFCFLLIHKFLKSDYLFVNIVSSFCLSYLMAILSYHYFESYFLKRKVHIS